MPAKLSHTTIDRDRQSERTPTGLAITRPRFWITKYVEDGSCHR